MFKCIDFISLQGNNVRIDINMSESTCDKWQKIDNKLTHFCHFGHITVNSDIFCQISVTLDNLLSILFHLSRVDLDMFMSIRTLFPCSVFSRDSLKISAYGVFKILWSIVGPMNITHQMSNAMHVMSEPFISHALDLQSF